MLAMKTLSRAWGGVYPGLANIESAGVHLLGQLMDQGIPTANNRWEARSSVHGSPSKIRPRLE